MTLPSDPAYPIADFNKMLSDAKIDLSPIELAEILWLAVQQSEGIAPVDLSSKSPESKTESSKTIDSSVTQSSTVPPETKSEVRAKIGMDSTETQEGTKKATTPLPVKIPEAVALRNRREIAKALRPLTRKVPSRIRQAIAEEETAIRIAEDQIWSPVVKPEPERWLELAIVIEVTNLFDVWRDTIAEFQHLMERHGAFRDVRTWQLQTSGNSKPQLFLQTATGLNRKPRSPKELLDASRRRLILFLSDCTSRAWRAGEIFKLLELWSWENPVTIAQLLPERHWDRSALRSGSLVALRSQLPGALSREWVVEGLSPRRRQRLRGGLKLPVVTIQPQPLGWWARATAAVGEQQTTGIVLRADAFQLDKPADAMTETLTAKQLVERFRGTASEKAQELADMMAVLPVNWSVLRLIQKNLVRKSADALQETAALYLAEIFLSGLLCPVSIAAEPDQKLSTTQQYDFVEGVRNVLLGAIPISEAREVGEEIATTIFKQLPAEVQDRVNADIDRRWGESLSYFEAFLMPDLPWGEDAAVEMLPFAQVTGDVLRRWGGKYAELAAELEQKRTPPEPVVIASKTELKTILLVEDEQKVIEDIREVLSYQYGIAVRGTDEVNEVIKLATSGEIDLILINRLLPRSVYEGREVNGFEIVKLLKSNLNISHDLPIVGFSLDYVEDEFLQYGADGFYSKRELLDSANFQKFVDYLQVVFNRVTQTKSSKPGKNYAIAIGINHYINLDSNQYAVKDAEDIYHFLAKEAGFEQVRLFTDNSFPLVPESEKPESSQLTPDLLTRFLDENLNVIPMSAEDNLWFFFSGHGIRLEDIDYLLLPANISERVEDRAIPVSFIVEQLQRYGTGNVILFLDADRDRAVYSSNLRVMDNPQQELGITSIAPPPDRGTIVFYSSSQGEEACEIESLQHGAFTYALLEALEQTKVGEAITVESLAQELLDRLPALIQQYSKPRQTPEVKAEPDSKNRLPLLPPRTTEMQTIQQEWLQRLNSQLFPVEVATIVFEEEGEGLLKLEFETVFLDKRGEITETKQCEAYYYDQPLEVESSVGAQGLRPTQENQPSSFSPPSEGGARGGLKSGNPKIQNLRMIYIPEGEFWMGSPEDGKDSYGDKSPQHLVKVPSFFMSQTPITEAQWRFVVNLPQEQKKLESNPSINGDDHPVVNISWQDAIEFCARLSRHTGRTYRLPSEAEWEYACRSVISYQLSVTSEELALAEWNEKYNQPFHFGETITSQLANYNGSVIYQQEPKGESRSKTTPVRTFNPNAFGLYDMHGNVWEWCLDPWHSNYEGAPEDGRVWDEGKEELYEDILKNLNILLQDTRTHVLRGGSWYDYPRYCRSAYRYGDCTRVNSYGFRVVCVPPRTP